MGEDAGAILSASILNNQRISTFVLDNNDLPDADKMVIQDHLDTIRRTGDSVTVDEVIAKFQDNNISDGGLMVHLFYKAKLRSAMGIGQGWTEEKQKNFDDTIRVDLLGKIKNSCMKFAFAELVVAHLSTIVVEKSEQNVSTPIIDSVKELLTLEVDEAAETLCRDPKGYWDLLKQRDEAGSKDESIIKNYEAKKADRELLLARQKSVVGALCALCSSFGTKEEIWRGKLNHLFFKFLSKVLLRFRTSGGGGNEDSGFYYRANWTLPCVYKEFEGFHFSIKWGASEMLKLEKMGFAKERGDIGALAFMRSQTRSRFGSNNHEQVLRESAAKISWGLKVLKISTEENEASSLNDSWRVKKVVESVTGECIMTLISVLKVVNKKALRKHFVTEEELGGWAEVQMISLRLLQRYLRQGRETGKGRVGAGKEKGSFDALITEHALKLLKEIIQSADTELNVKVRTNALHVLELCSDDVVFQQRTISNANNWLIWEANKEGSNVDKNDASVSGLIRAQAARRRSVKTARLSQDETMKAELSPSKKRWNKVMRSSLVASGFKYKGAQPLILFIFECLHRLCESYKKGEAVEAEDLFLCKIGTSILANLILCDSPNGAMTICAFCCLDYFFDVFKQSFDAEQKHTGQGHPLDLALNCSMIIRRLANTHWGCIELTKQYSERVVDMYAMAVKGINALAAEGVEVRAQDEWSVAVFHEKCLKIKENSVAAMANVMCCVGEAGGKGNKMLLAARETMLRKILEPSEVVVFHEIVKDIRCVLRGDVGDGTGGGDHMFLATRFMSLMSVHAVASGLPIGKLIVDECSGSFVLRCESFKMEGAFGKIQDPAEFLGQCLFVLKDYFFIERSVTLKEEEIVKEEEEVFVKGRRVLYKNEGNKADMFVQMVDGNRTQKNNDGTYSISNRVQCIRYDNGDMAIFHGKGSIVEYLEVFRGEVDLEGRGSMVSTIWGGTLSAASQVMKSMNTRKSEGGGSIWAATVSSWKDYCVRIIEIGQSVEGHVREESLGGVFELMSYLANEIADFRDPKFLDGCVDELMLQRSNNWWPLILEGSLAYCGAVIGGKQMEMRGKVEECKGCLLERLFANGPEMIGGERFMDLMWEVLRGEGAYGATRLPILYNLGTLILRLSDGEDEVVTKSFVSRKWGEKGLEWVEALCGFVNVACDPHRLVDVWSRVIMRCLRFSLESGGAGCDDFLRVVTLLLSKDPGEGRRGSTDENVPLDKAYWGCNLSIVLKALGSLLGWHDTMGLNIAIAGTSGREGFYEVLIPDKNTYSSVLGRFLDLTRTVDLEVFDSSPTFVSDDRLDCGSYSDNLLKIVTGLFCCPCFKDYVLSKEHAATRYIKPKYASDLEWVFILPFLHKTNESRKLALNVRRSEEWSE